MATDNTSLLNRLLRPFAEVGGNVGAVATSLLNPTARRVLWGKSPGSYIGGRTYTNIKNPNLVSAEQSVYAPYKALGFSDTDRANLLANQQKQGALLSALKTGAGVMSYGIPGGTTLPSAIGRGALSGSMYGLGTSGAGQELSGMTSGAIGGGVGGAAGYGLSEAISGLTKLGGKESGLTKGLEKYATGRESNAIKRMVGINAPSNTVMSKAVEYSSKYNVPINSEQSLMDIAGKAFGEWGDVVDDLAAQASSQGKTVNFQEILNGLDDFKMKQAPSDRAAVDKVINDLTGLISENGEDLTSAVAIKRVFGAKGKWKVPWQTESPVAVQAYENVYKDISNQLGAEDLLGKTFRDANENIETALDLRQWAQKAAEKKNTSATLNDPLQDITLFGAMTGGGPGAIAGAITGKVTQSPQFERVLGQGAQGLANILSKVPTADITPIMQQGLQQAGRWGGTLASTIGQMQASGATPQETADYLQSQGVTQQDLAQTLAGGQQQYMSQIPQQDAMQQGLQKLAQLQAAGVPDKTLQSLYVDLVMNQGQTTTGGDVNSYINAIQSGYIKPTDVPDELLPSVLSGLGQVGYAPKSDLSASGQKFNTAVTAAQDALGLLEQGAQSGPLATILGKTSEVFGKESIGTSYRSALAFANTALKNAFLGGAMNEQELRSLQDALPSPNDQEAVAKRKLEDFVKLASTMIQ